MRLQTDLCKGLYFKDCHKTWILQGLILLISGEAYHRGGQSVVGDSWTKSAFEELLFI